MEGWIDGWVDFSEDEWLLNGCVLDGWVDEWLDAGWLDEDAFDIYSE